MVVRLADPVIVEEWLLLANLAPRTRVYSLFANYSSLTERFRGDWFPLSTIDTRFVDPTSFVLVRLQY
jgi:hypothetical protein